MVPWRTLVNDVMMDIHSLKIDDLKDIDVFDVYEPTNNDEYKSLSFHLIFRNNERTLSSNEIEKYLELITKHLTSKGYKIR
jgi:phenylalanyl-tRNA synthetase beta subunit